MNDTRREVLRALSEGTAAGPDLAERAGVSRAAVWKHVEALRDAGFDVESDGNGYRLAGVPEYGGTAVEYGLHAPYEVEFHGTVDSTNDRARELAAAGADGTVVLADRQTHSKGRLDREWTSPSGGVWASVVVRPDLPPAGVPLVTLAAAVATTRALREAGVDAGIKWPNDVLARDDGRKFAGILTEMEGEADRVNWVVVGVGANVNVDAADLPETATSVRERVGDVDRRAFVQRLLEAFHDLLGDPDAVLDAWREQALTLGQRVRVETPSGDVVGEAVDVEPPGTLVVATDDGDRRVHAGDCEHLRPA